MMRSYLIGIVTTVVTLVACSSRPSTPATPAIPADDPTTAASAPGTATVSAPGPAVEADIIFVNGHLITMDNANPRAEAIAVEGDSIAAVGSSQEVLAYAGPDTLIVDLEGRTMTPGFIDAHQHRIGDRWKRDIENARDVIDPAVAQGWTTIEELYVDQGRLDELLALDAAGDLTLRVNAYLPVQANSPDGELFDSYYDAYQPGEQVSPHVRVAGLKVFTDFDNAAILLWQQDALNDFLLARHQQGWQLAIKTVSTRSLEMILIAFEHMQSVDTGVVESRGRLEHALSMTPEQIARIKALGLIPIVNLNIPAEMIGDTETEAFLATEPPGAIAPWRDLAEGGVLFANGSAWPSYYVDEPDGAPFGSPMHLIYQAVTRVGNLGTPPYDWMLDQTISAEQAMRAMTIDAAYASFQEDSLGSLSPGKLADMVILSDDPLAVEPEAINHIEVLMTMVGGVVVHCQSGSERLCYAADVDLAAAPPESPPAEDYPLISASASLPADGPQKAFDGNLDSIWNSGDDAPQWIQIDLGSPQSVEAVNLNVAQYPEGETVHELWAGPDADRLSLLHTFTGFTRDGDILTYVPEAPLADLRILRVETVQSPSWAAWHEIEIVLTPEE